ncbi:MAG: DUF3054 domain-containing protein [Haloplanus sp.]
MASAVAEFVDRRLDASAAPMAVGDVVVLALLYSAGAVRHDGVAFLVANPGYLAATIAPFLVGWIIAAPLLGAYSPGAAESSKAAVPLALRSWILGDAIALGIRATPLVHGGVELSFVAVTLGVGMVGLALWRTLFFRLFR